MVVKISFMSLIEELSSLPWNRMYKAQMLEEVRNKNIFQTIANELRIKAEERFQDEVETTFSH